MQSEIKLLTLEKLLTDFYISKISEELNVNECNIDYESSSEVYINDIELKEYCDHKISRKRIFQASEKKVYKYLSTFKCSKNEDLESFLHSKSIGFHKRNKTRTYLIINCIHEIMGYFSLAIKPITIKENDNVSGKRKSKANSKILDDKTHMLSTYLVAQLGRDDKFNTEDLNLETIFLYIMEIIKSLKSLIGGTTILIEVDNEPKLIEKYKEYGFEYLKDEESGLTQLWKLTLDY